MNVVFCGTGWLDIVDAIRERLPDGVSIRIRDVSRPLPEEVRDADVILPSNGRIDAAAIAAARGLKLIQQPAVGYEGVDLDAARARGIPVCNAPGKNDAAVAETTLLLLLALSRRYEDARRAFAQARVGTPAGVELEGKTLGLIGYGASGSRVGRAAVALGMNVLYVRSSSTDEEREDLLRRSDFVSLHCPLTTRTRHLLDDHAFGTMKRGAYLINVARAGIVDRKALERALDAGILSGCALDTLWEEPWDPADPLFARPNVITTPHIGGSSRESFARLADVVAENVRRIQRGEEPAYRVA